MVKSLLLDEIYLLVMIDMLCESLEFIILLSPSPFLFLEEALNCFGVFTDPENLAKNPPLFYSNKYRTIIKFNAVHSDT